MKNDLGIDYKEFLKRYVFDSPYEYSISFTYKGRNFQFDWINEESEKSKNHYCFFEYSKNWDQVIQKFEFKDLKKAISSICIDGASFEDIYNSDESELIDIS